MLNRLELKNFKGIKSGRIRLFPLTILLGSNNAGKSSVLEALFLAPNPTRKVPYHAPIGGRVPRESVETALDIVSYLHEFTEYKGYGFLPFNYRSEVTEIKCTRSRGRQRKNYRLRLFREKSQIYFSTSEKIDNTTSIKIGGEDVQIFASAGLTGRLDTRNNRPWMEETFLISPTLTKLSFLYLTTNWAPIVNSKVLRKIAKDASSLSPDNYIDFTLEPFIARQLELHAYFKDGRRIRLGDLGEGIKNYIIARILYDSTNPSILLWDDIESHCNPKMLLHLAEWISVLLSRRKQIIISTHSLEAARLIAGVNEEKTRICVTSLDDSILKTKSLTLEELQELKKAGIDARTAEAMLL